MQLAMLDLEHGPGAGSGFLPRLPPPTCSRPFSVVGLGLLVMRVLCRSLPVPALNCFSLCDLRLFVSKRMFLSSRACARNELTRNTSNTKGAAPAGAAPLLTHPPPAAFCGDPAWRRPRAATTACRRARRGSRASRTSRAAPRRRTCPPRSRAARPPPRGSARLQ